MQRFIVADDPHGGEKVLRARTRRNAASTGVASTYGKPTMQATVGCILQVKRERTVVKDVEKALFAWISRTSSGGESLFSLHP